MKVKMPRTQIASLGVIFVNVVWGLSFIGSRICLGAGFEPFSLVTVRFCAAVLFLFPLAVIRKIDLRIRLRDVPAIAGSALMGITIYFYFELNGLKHTSAATASLIVAAIPVLTMLAGVLFHRQRPIPMAWFGAILSLIGVWLVVSSGNEQDSVKGVLLMTGACFSWVAYGELTDLALKKYSTYTVTCWQSLFSLISLIPLSLTEKVPWPSLTPASWVTAIVFLGVICSAMSFVLYNDGIAVLSKEKTAMFLNLNPIAAILGSVLILGERMTVKQIIGSVVVIAALYLVNRPDIQIRNRRERREKDHGTK